MSDIILKAKHIVKYFDDGKNRIDVLKDLSIDVHAGEFVSIIGASGSGKSTLLHILGGLDLPTQGEIYLDGQRLDLLNESQRGELRNQKLGFVYQFHHLLPEFSAVENVAMPLMLRPNSQFKIAKQRAEYLLERVGLAHRLNHKSSELSGGERQRVALARALAGEPKVVLADEPTGNLDRQTALAIFTLLTELKHEFNMAMLIVTHDEILAKSADRILKMQDGHWLE